MAQRKSGDYLALCYSHREKISKRSTRKPGYGKNKPNSLKLKNKHYIGTPALSVRAVWTFVRPGWRVPNDRRILYSLSYTGYLSLLLFSRTFLAVSLPFLVLHAALVGFVSLLLAWIAGDDGGYYISGRRCRCLSFVLSSCVGRHVCFRP